LGDADVDYVLSLRLHRSCAATLHRQSRTAVVSCTITPSVTALYRAISNQKSVGIGRLFESQSFTDPSLAFTNPRRHPREPSRSGWHRALMVSPALMYSRVTPM